MEELRVLLIQEVVEVVLLLIAEGIVKEEQEVLE
jgi:hypothetical protein